MRFVATSVRIDDFQHFTLHLRFVDRLRALKVAITHQSATSTVNGINPMKDQVVVMNCQYDITNTYVLLLPDKDLVASPSDERQHADALRGKQHRLAFVKPLEQFGICRIVCLHHCVTVL